MKSKSQLTLAALLVAGMFASGCQQMQQTAGAGQQTTGGSQQAAEAPAIETPVRTEVEVPATGRGNTHTHPAIPGCTNSVTHSHPSNNPNHTHSYGCKGGQRALMVPQVKAKGNYKGAVRMDSASKAAMQQYQQ